MFAMIFKLQPKQEKFDEHLKLAKYRKLAVIDRFIDIDSFMSSTQSRQEHLPLKLGVMFRHFGSVTLRCRTCSLEGIRRSLSYARCAPWVLGGLALIAG